MTKVFIRPVNGAKVRHPDSKMHLKEEGELVEQSPYWQRRINDKSVVVVENKEPQKPSKIGDK